MHTLHVPWTKRGTATCLKWPAAIDAWLAAYLWLSICFWVTCYAAAAAAGWLATCR